MLSTPCHQGAFPLRHFPFPSRMAKDSANGGGAEMSASSTAPAAAAPADVMPAAAAAAPKSSRTAEGFIYKASEFIALSVVFAVAAWTAYSIRLYAIEVYGRVIHEFDPWFNMRATQYLADNGAKKFFTWFDYMSWYPLGRPVGTTIYPGMQFTAVWIWNVLKWKWWRKIFVAVGLNSLKIKMSLNDVCVFIPAWFGAIASVVLGMLTAEVSGSWRAGAASSLIMAVIPAHIMRSVGGGYDNESVAMTAMVLTFYAWTRSLRTSESWWIGALAGLAYFNMVAAWGGFIFVGNMVSTHAFLLVLLGYYSPSLWKAYSLFYIVGTIGAIQIPVVGMSPFKSIEQLGLLGVFLGLQGIALSDYLAAREGIFWSDKEAAEAKAAGKKVALDPATQASKRGSSFERFRQALAFRTRFAFFCGAALVVPIAVLYPTGYFGGFSVRIKSLFIKHTKTGNPLVDSVAEHQASSTAAYWHYLHYASYLAVFGFFGALLKGTAQKERMTSGIQVNKWFIVLFAGVAYYFASRMQRLIILLGPLASSLAGIAIGYVVDFMLSAVSDMISLVLVGEKVSAEDAAPRAKEEAAASSKKGAAPTPLKRSAKGESEEGKKAREAAEAHPLSNFGLKFFAPAAVATEKALKSTPGRVIRMLIAVAVTVLTPPFAVTFYQFSDKFSRDMSQPSIMFKAQLRDGQTVMINDYQEAYWWLRDHTPQDSRVLSWWDYGYQLTGIGNRTSLADGNTWNLEHIALLGRILTSPEKRAHSLARHLADYVLIWAGNQGDDLSKSPHMARIGSSVYPDICPRDPLCRNFGFYSDKKPTESMANSMLYKMHRNGLEPGVKVNKKYFEDVYQSKYGLVRIYKILNISETSKQWLADPANRLCDRPGSWYCPGQYPPEFPKPPKTHRNLD
jgi:dolichyl-diphosphooligosaccharide---protein glycosyltransferase